MPPSTTVGQPAWESPPTPLDSSSATSPGSDLAAKPACSLLSEADASALLGTPVNKAIGSIYSGEQVRKDWPDASRVSGCQYLDAVTPLHPGYVPRTLGIAVTSKISADPSAVVAFHRAAEVNGDQKHREVEGVGDAAIWLTHSLDWSRLPYGRLKIFVGGQTELDVSVNGLPTESAALEVAKQVGMRLLGGIARTNFTYTARPVRPALARPALGPLSAAPSDAEKLKHNLTAKADAGEAHAQFALAAVYRFATFGPDQRIKPAYLAAAYWYERAAANGMPEAAYDLAVLYRDGLGVPADAEAAIEYFTKAAEAGYVPAMRDLSSVYLKRDNWGGAMRALPWLEKAGAAGDSDSMLRLGYIESTGASGTMKNDIRAMRHYEAAAALGNCVAMMDIGLMYFNGSQELNRRPDAAQSQRWLAKAEACDAADAAGVRDEAARYRDKAARGELPAFVERRRPDRAEPSLRISDRDWVALAFVASLAYAVANAGTLSNDDAGAGIKQIDANLKFRRDMDNLRQRTERSEQVDRCQRGGGHWCY